MNRSIILSLVLLLMITGCSRDKDRYANKAAEELYQMAQVELDKENYDTAAEIYDEVDRQHPYSQFATKAQLMKGFSQYKAQKYPGALASFETFIQLHPGHEDAAYASYLRAMCYYEQIFSVKRDQNMAEKALSSFEEIMMRFPESEYAKDAKLKRDLTLDHIAGKEMMIGRYYLKKDAQAAAANRFRVVLDHYQETSHTPEALHRLVECYMAMGLEKEALETAAVLGHNYADSAWYADTYYLLSGVDHRHKDPNNTTLWEKVLGIKIKG